MVSCGRQKLSFITAGASAVEKHLVVDWMMVKHRRMYTTERDRDHQGAIHYSTILLRFSTIDSEDSSEYANTERS